MNEVCNSSYNICRELRTSGIELVDLISPLSNEKPVSFAGQLGHFDFWPERDHFVVLGHLPVLIAVKLTIDSDDDIRFGTYDAQTFEEATSEIGGELVVSYFRIYTLKGLGLFADTIKKHWLHLE